MVDVPLSLMAESLPAMPMDVKAIVQLLLDVYIPLIVAIALFVIYQLVRHRAGMPMTVGSDALWLLVSLDLSALLVYPKLARFVLNVELRERLWVVFTALFVVGLALWVVTVAGFEYSLERKRSAEVRMGLADYLKALAGWLFVSTMTAANIAVYMVK